MAFFLKIHGGAEGARTPDLLNAIQALSQLSYSPFRNILYIHLRLFCQAF